MVFPVIKLGYLAFKQVSKPLASFMKARAKSSPFFRRYICAYPAQIYHRFETNIRMRLLGLHPDTVKPLNEEMAVELGAEMLGEVVIFTTAGFVLWLEYLRSSTKEQAKDAIITERIDQLRTQLQDLGLVLEEQDTKIRELTRLVHSVHDATISSRIAKVLGTGKPDNVDSVDGVATENQEIKLGPVEYQHKAEENYQMKLDRNWNGDEK